MINTLVNKKHSWLKKWTQPQQSIPTGNMSRKSPDKFRKQLVLQNLFKFKN